MGFCAQTFKFGYIIYAENENFVVEKNYKSQV